MIFEVAAGNFRSRQTDARGKSDVPEPTNDHPGRIGLTRVQTDARRFGKGVVVVVPALAHGHETIAREVRCLHAGAVHVPASGPRVVREKGDDPVPYHTDADTYDHTPDHPAPSA